MSGTPARPAEPGRLWGGLAPGSKVFVDTAPFIYLFEAHPVFAARFAGLFAAADAGLVQVALSTITLAEVLVGPQRAGQAGLAKRYEAALGRFEVAPVTVPIAALAAQLRAQHRLRLPDALQLATALEIGASAFVTHDRDFAGCVGATGLQVMMGEGGDAA